MARPSQLGYPQICSLGQRRSDKLGSVPQYHPYPLQAIAGLGHARDIIVYRPEDSHSFQLSTSMRCSRASRVATDGCMGMARIEEVTMRCAQTEITPHAPLDASHPAYYPAMRCIPLIPLIPAKR
jgi:hypothetical protein